MDLYCTRAAERVFGEGKEPIFSNDVPEFAWKSLNLTVDYVTYNVKIEH